MPAMRFPFSSHQQREQTATSPAAPMVMHSAMHPHQHPHSPQQPTQFPANPAIDALKLRSNKIGPAPVPLDPRVGPGSPCLSSHHAETRHRYKFRFEELQASWQRLGKVDNRYESLVDDLVADLSRGSYPYPHGFQLKYATPSPTVIGSGSNGRLFRAHELRTGKEVAVKITLAMYGATQEVQMLRHCQGGKVVKLLDHFADEVACVLVMELAGTSWTHDNPNLSNNPHVSFPASPSSPHRRVNRMDMYACLRAHGRLPGKLTNKLFGEIVEIVLFLHRVCEVTHGDLKPQNLLVDSNYTVKVADFSAMKRLRDGPVRRFAGAPMFGAPEALQGNFDGELNDIWAMGVVLFMLRFGADREPEFGRGRKLVWPSGGEVVEGDQELRDLLTRMLEQDPLRRPRIEEVASHPYVGPQLAKIRPHIFVRSTPKKLVQVDSEATLTSDGSSSGRWSPNPSLSKNGSPVSGSKGGLKGWLVRFSQ